MAWSGTGFYSGCSSAFGHQGERPRWQGNVPALCPHDQPGRGNRCCYSRRGGSAPEGTHYWHTGRKAVFTGSRRESSEREGGLSAAQLGEVGDRQTARRRCQREQEEDRGVVQTDVCDDSLHLSSCP